MMQGIELQIRALHLKQLDALAGSENPNLQLKQLVEGTTSTAISSKERSSRSPRLISDPDRDGKDTKDRAGDDGGASSPTEGTLESTSRKNSKSFSIKIGHMLRQFHKKIAIFEYNSDYSLKSSTYLNNNLFSLLIPSISNSSPVASPAS